MNSYSTNHYRIMTIALLLLMLCPCTMAQDKNKKNRTSSLAESILQSQQAFKRANATRTYWKRTFSEIRNSILTENYTIPSPTKWKQQHPRRFEGFPSSWERNLVTWKKDVAEYMERNSGGDYPMSTFGRPPTMKRNETIVQEKDEKAEEETLEEAMEEKQKESLDAEEETIFTSQFNPTPATQTQEVLPHTDLSDKSKKIWIVTTAALPWMTGTAVNPLLRAAHLVKGRAVKKGKVTLMLPWLERKSDQDRVYGRLFETPQQQEEYIRTWLAETANLQQASQELNIAWYTAWQQRAENSLYSMGDITALIPQQDVDICILEEPEHLNWYRAPGESWTFKFKHVVGIIHTNYFCYAQEQPAALIRAPAMKLLCSWMCRAHCHRVIKLSATLGKFCPEKELVENVHGVRDTFLRVGQELALQNLQENDVFGPHATVPKVYFIGKMLWSKGLGSLMELLQYAQESADLQIQVDMYGGGPDLKAARSKATKLGLQMPFYGPIDHAELAMTHKIFINPSTSEVLCTTVAEALAMGKFVVLPSHPSNDFFAQFPNCLPYSNKEEFVGNLYYALTHAPEPLTREYSHALSWEAATERLEAAGSITVEEAKVKSQALSSSQAGVEINLPPLIEDEEARRAVSTTLRRSRHRYRQFRSRLSQEVQQSNVLPKDLQKRLVTELDKRLDIDIDTVLEAPKLRLQLSPAELDKVLLEFYNQATVGRSGDLLRVIGGGTDVGYQDLYLKRQARERKRQQQQGGVNGEEEEADEDYLSFLLEEPDDGWLNDPQESIATQLVKRALRRNLPSVRKGGFSLGNKKKTSQTSLGSKKSDTPKMSLYNRQHGVPSRGVHVPLGGMHSHPLVQSSWTPPLTPLI